MNSNKGENLNNEDVKNTVEKKSTSSSSWKERLFIIKYDKNFLTVELFSTLFIFALIMWVSLWGNKLLFNDPIAKAKNNFFAIEIIIISLTVITTILVSLFTKNKKTLLNYFNIIMISSILFIILLFEIKLYLNKEYTDETFSQFYENYSSTTQVSANHLLDKDTYIQKSKEAYTIFSIKSSLYLMIYSILVLIILHLSNRVYNVGKKNNRIIKENAVVYNEDNISDKKWL